MKALWTTLCLSLVAAGWAAVAEAALGAAGVVPGCGSLENPFGPYDYRRDKKQLAMVERYHFSTEIENLRSYKPGLGLDYTLRAFPNHHRALMAMMNLAIQQKKPRPVGASQTIECYMIRAEWFRPDDATVKVIFGLFLLKAGQQKEGIEKMEAAKKLGATDPSIPYNVGLAYFDIGDHEKALANAHEAYRLGFPLPGLRNKLEKAGKWRDPAPDAAAAPTTPRAAAPDASPAAESPAEPQAASPK